MGWLSSASFRNRNWKVVRARGSLGPVDHWRLRSIPILRWLRDAGRHVETDYVPSYQGAQNLASDDRERSYRAVYGFCRRAREVTAHEGDTLRVRDCPNENPSCGDGGDVDAMGWCGGLLRGSVHRADMMYGY